MRDEASVTTPLQRPEHRTGAGRPPAHEAPDPSRPPSPQLLLALQRTAGNQATVPVVARAKGISTRSTHKGVRKDAPHRAGVRKSGTKERRTPASKESQMDRDELDRLKSLIVAEYDAEPFGSGTGKRVTRVSAPVTIRRTHGRRAAPPPLSESSVWGTAAGQKSGYDGGHVVGLRLGGEDVSRNVVPMYRAFNRGPYSTVEDEIERKVRERAHTGVPVLTVACGYAGPDPDVPTTFTLSLAVRKVAAAHVKTWTLSQPDAIPRLPDLDEKTAKLFTATFSALDRNEELHIAKSTRAEYPDHPAKRIYGHLDVLWAEKKLGIGGAPQAFKGFSSDQRTLILQDNKRRNGFIKSDDPEDLKEHEGRLDERGTDNFPEIDHIIPQVLGGSNAFSNARVVSWRRNNVEARVKPIHTLVDITRLAAPTVRADPDGYRTVALQYLYRVALRAHDRTAFSADDVHRWATTGPGMLFPTIALVKADTATTAITTALQDLVTAGTLATSDDGFVVREGPGPGESAPAADDDPMDISD